MSLFLPQVSFPFMLLFYTFPWTLSTWSPLILPTRPHGCTSSVKPFFCVPKETSFLHEVHVNLLPSPTRLTFQSTSNEGKRKHTSIVISGKGFKNSYSPNFLDSFGIFILLQNVVGDTFSTSSVRFHQDLKTLVAHDYLHRLNLDKKTFSQRVLLPGT